MFSAKRIDVLCSINKDNFSLLRITMKRFRGKILSVLLQEIMKFDTTRHQCWIRLRLETTNLPHQCASYGQFRTCGECVPQLWRKTQKCKSEITHHRRDSFQLRCFQCCTSALLLAMIFCLRVYALRNMWRRSVPHPHLRMYVFPPAESESGVRGSFCAHHAVTEDLFPLPLSFQIPDEPRIAAWRLDLPDTINSQ